jgi:hypothetical protein
LLTWPLAPQKRIKTETESISERIHQYTIPDRFQNVENRYYGTMDLGNAGISERIHLYQKAIE